MTGTIAAGEWKDGIFHFPIRVYYEDTDIGGMVYHGRYISFFERVRSESIRGTDADVNHLFELAEDEGGPLTYVVSSINVKYHRQATVGDILIGHSMVKRVRAAAIEVKQWITRNGKLVAEADLVVAVIGNDGRPKRWPNSARICWQNMMDEATAAGKNT